MHYFAKHLNPFRTPVLVTNEAKSIEPQFQRLTLNFLPAKTRIEILEGREHTVVPMVMMVEGVIAGSGGPILYNEEELSKTPEVWNHKPVVVYHPEMNGQAVSACGAEVINTRKVGLMMNTTWDKKTKRLKSEAWLEKPRADVIDNRIFEALGKKEMMELSTGLFVDLEKSSGDWNGTDYDGVARNIRPDHLALLPDKIGACSINMGGGLLRNEMANGKIDPKQMLKRLAAFVGLTDNEMSHENVRMAIQTALRAKFNPLGIDKLPYMWVEAVYSDFFVYDGGDGKLFRLGYSSSDAGVSLSEDAPVEVFRVTEYRTVAGAKFVGNEGQPDTTTTNSDLMNKTKMIVAILAANIGWEQKGLDALNDKQVESIHNGIAKPPAPTTNEPAPAPAPAPQLTIVPKPTTNEPTAPAAPVTLESWLGSAPPEVAGAVRSLLSNENAERATLIEKIVKNESLGFTKDDLTGSPIGNLRKLAKLADAPKPAALQPYQPMADFSGMAPTAPLGNDAPYEEEVLTAPVLNFSKEKKTAAA